LPSGVTFQSASGCTGTTQVVCSIGTLIANTSASRTIVVRVDSDTIGSLANSAVAGANTTDPITSNNTANTNTTVNTLADLQLSMSASPNPVIAGNLLTYNISLSNVGPSDALGVTLTDTLPSSVTFQSATGCSNNSGQVTCTIGSLANGANTNRMIVVRVNSGSLDFVNNIAGVNSSTSDPVNANNTASTNTTINTQADLVLGISAAPSPVIAGDLLTYTLTITNTGPSDALGATIIDTLTFGVTYQSASAGCNYSSGQVTCNVGSIVAGTSTNRFIVVRVDPAVTGILVNSAVVSSSTFDPISSNNSKSINTTVNAETDISISVFDTPEALPPGDVVTYTIKVKNLGPSNALGVAITSTLPISFTPQTAIPTQGNCVISTNLSCSLGGLFAGQTATIILSGAVDGSASPGVISLTAFATSTTYDPNTGNNQETENTFISNEIANLNLIVVASPDPVIAGTTLIYQAQITNNGPSISTGVTFTSTIPGLSTFINAVPGQGTCEFNTTLSCELGTISQGGQVTLTYQVLVDPAATEFVDNLAWIDAQVPDPNFEDNVVPVSTVVLSRADLWISQEDVPDPVVSGGQLTYSLTVGNFGPSNALGLQVVDTLPSGVQFISSTPASPTCFLVGNNLTCSLGNLGSSETTQIQIKVQVSQQIAGTITNQATVASFTTDPSNQNNTSLEDTNVVDNILPVAAWELPVGNTERYTVFNETVLLRVNVSDNVGIQRVIFSRYDANLGQTVTIGEDTSAPYEWTLDATTLNFDWNQINALAYDTSGNVSDFANDQSFIWLFRTKTGYKIYLPITIR